MGELDEFEPCAPGRFIVGVGAEPMVDNADRLPLLFSNFDQLSWGGALVVVAG